MSKTLHVAFVIGNEDRPELAIASLWVDPSVVESEIMNRLEFIVPGLQALLGQNIESIVNARAPITGIAVLILFWTASNIFTALTRAMDRVWGVELTWSRSAFRQRGLAMLMVLFLGIAVLLVSLYGGTVVAIEDLESSPHYDGPSRRISIFMSVFNAHVNRAPFECTVREVLYAPGSYKNAMRPDSSKINESNAIWLDTLKGAMTVRQQLSVERFL